MTAKQCVHVARRETHRGWECTADPDSRWFNPAQLAERVGVDRAYVSGLEQGSRNPTIITLWHVAEALGGKLEKLTREPRSTKRHDRAGR
jgi:transcriptional regulator with XRE-family HTH domain